MKITPVGNRVQIQRDPVSRYTDSGLELGTAHNTPRENVQTGIVLAIGPGRLRTEDGEREVIQLTIGDRIAFDPAESLDCPCQGHPNGEVTIVDIDGVWGVIEPCEATPNAQPATGEPSGSSSATSSTTPNA